MGEQFYHVELLDFKNKTKMDNIDIWNEIDPLLKI